MYLQLPLFDRHTEAEKTSSISSAIKTIRATNGNHAACSPFSFFIQVSQVTSGPRRGPTFNNRWWNDRRSWNLRIRHRERGSVPKGGEPHPVLPLFAPFGDDKRVSVTIRRFHDLRSFHPRLFTFAPFGDGECLIDFLPQKRYIILPHLFFSFFLKENPRNFRKFQ